MRIVLIFFAFFSMSLSILSEDYVEEEKKSSKGPEETIEEVSSVITETFASNDTVAEEEVEKPQGETDRIERNFVEDSLNIHYYMWVGRTLYVRNKDSKIFDTSPKKWSKNITNPEWNDGDSFVTNYIYHPYFGALYYQIYKDLGYENNQAYMGSVLQSALWEFAIEGTVEKPSLLDTVVTPGFGIPLGIYFEKLNTELETSPYLFKRALSYIINPAKIFLSEGDIGFVNPVSGSFMVHKPFKYSDHERETETNYSFLGNNPLPNNSFRLRSYFFDIKQYKGGGSDIFYFVDTEFANSSNDFSLFLSFPWAGAYDGNDKNYEVVDNGFEVGNFQVGAKKVLHASSSVDLSGTLGLSLPTSTLWDDSKNRLEKLQPNSVFLKDTLHDSTIIAPEVFLISKYIQVGFGTEFFFNADDYSGEREEIFFVYDVDISLFSSKDDNYVLLYEFKAINQFTERNKDLDTISAVTFRSRKELEFGISFLLPMSGQIQEYMHNGIAVDLTFPLY
jgi:hypothetical protein